VAARFVLRIGGGVVPLPTGQLVIGRGHDCDVIVDDDLASRRHALLYVGDAQVELEDAKSRNGVLVDGLKVDKRTVLHHGAVIGIGNARLILQDSDKRQVRRVEVTPSKPLARIGSPLGRQVSHIQGTLVGVSLSALVFRARAAVHSASLEELRDAAEKLSSQLGPDLAVDADLVDESLKAFAGCTLALAAQAPGSSEWPDALLSMHTKLARVPDDDVVRQMNEAAGNGVRPSADAVAAHATALRARKTALSPDERARMERVGALARGIPR
jgi:hypothetical protein